MTEPARKKICLSITPSNQVASGEMQYQIQVTVDDQPISSTVGLFQPKACTDPAVPYQINFLSDKLCLAPVSTTASTSSTSSPASPSASSTSAAFAPSADVVPGPATPLTYHSKVAAALSEMEISHPVGSPQYVALRQKSLNILKTMLTTGVGQALALRDNWVGPNCPVSPPCGLDMKLLAAVRDASESVYRFQMHYMNEVMHQQVPEVAESFRSRYMCPGFVFVPVGCDSGNYGRGLPAQLLGTSGEESIPWGRPIGTNGGNFDNSLSRYRLATLDEIMAMFSKRGASVDPSLF